MILLGNIDNYRKSEQHGEFTAAEAANMCFLRCVYIYIYVYIYIIYYIYILYIYIYYILYIYTYYVGCFNRFHLESTRKSGEITIEGIQLRTGNNP